LTQSVNRRTTAAPDRSPYEFGDLLRKWRDDRKVSQLALASRAGVSTRHLSFVETGRSSPGRDLVVRLAEHLDVPLRERNRMLLAAGYAPLYPESTMQAPELTMIRQAIRQVLTGHAPYPALVVDRGWNLVEANSAVPALFLEGAPDDLLAAPFNVLRFSLHPRGLAPRIRNLRVWRNHVLERLERQTRLTADPLVRGLLEELREYPHPDSPSAAPADSNAADATRTDQSGTGAAGSDLAGADQPGTGAAGAVVVPILLEHEGRTLSMFSTVTTFGTPRDITVEELAIESFYPTDPDTADHLRHLATRTTP
jgi:transcriptional regulator with XRE-family HTH domain